jgi:hypothetical protein
MASNGTLSPKQEKALAALMTSPSIAEAARRAGLGERTVVRWLSEHQPFTEAYLVGRRQAMSLSITSLQVATTEAVAALRSVMNDEGSPANARVSAASKCLELALKGLELEDLESRVSALEGGRAQSNGRDWRHS